MRHLAGALLIASLMGSCSTPSKGQFAIKVSEVEADHSVQLLWDQPGQEATVRVTVTVDSPIANKKTREIAVAVIPNPHQDFSGRLYVRPVDEVTGEAADRIPVIALGDECSGGCTRTYLVTFGWDDTDGVPAGWDEESPLGIRATAKAEYWWFEDKIYRRRSLISLPPSDLMIQLELVSGNG